MVPKPPERLPAHLLVGQQLVHRRAPEVAVRQAVGAVELQGHLVTLVGVLRRHRAVEFLLDQPVGMIVNIPHRLVGRRPVLRAVRDPRQPVAVVPGVLGNVRVAAAQFCVAIHVAELPRAIALLVVQVTVGPVRLQAVARTRRIAAAGAVAVGVVTGMKK